MAISVATRHFLGIVAADSRSLPSHNYVRMQRFVRRSTYVPFRRFLGDVRREFMQGLLPTLYGTTGSYLRDASQEGNVDTVWYAFMFLGLRLVGFFLFFPFYWMFSLLFLVRNIAF
jgi:hypothetical protein